MVSRVVVRKLTLTVLIASVVFMAGHAFADETIKGQVLGGGAPVGISTVTLWEASAVAPKQLAQAKTDNEGHFQIRAAGHKTDTSLYLLATGGVPKGKSSANQYVVLLAVVGSKPPAQVIIDEFTTIASAITHNQFINDTAIVGSPLALQIAAGNVPNFVNLTTGDWGEAILGPLNSSETPTMANFGTLANVLAACVTQLKSDACSRLFAAATPPAGAPPADMLAATEFIVRYPWHQPAKVFDAFNELYPQPKIEPGQVLRQTPFLPYLTFAP